MKFLAPLALASLAIAAPAEKRAPTPLDVQLKQVGNSKVEAVVTNNGHNNLRLLKTGTFLDKAATEKAKVKSKGKADNVAFEGVKLRVSKNHLTENSFQSIPAGKSITVSFDVAELHDLTDGGDYDIESSGHLSFAAPGSTKLIGSVPYHSNILSAKIDGLEAAASRTSFKGQKRTAVQDCTGDRASITSAALSGCASIASAAASAASSGDAAKVEEYFKNSDQGTRDTVAGVFSAVASECGSESGGVSRYYCSDVYQSCSDGVLAYTLPSESYMVMCDLYFSDLPGHTGSCHAQDQAGTNIHEMTHLSEIKGTDDYGGYGYDFVQSLSAEQNINHADTYALFANAIDVGC